MRPSINSKYSPLALMRQVVIRYISLRRHSSRESFNNRPLSSSRYYYCKNIDRPADGQKVVNCGKRISPGNVDSFLTLNKKRWERHLRNVILEIFVR